MNTLKIEDLPHSIDLDREAMAELIGCGLWGSVKNYTKKAGRYVKERAKQQIRKYRFRYYDEPRHAIRTMFYELPRDYIYRPIRRRL